MITKNYIAKGEGANRFEKVPVRIYEKPSEAVKAVAREIADLIRTNADKSEKCVLGLATGSSPIKLYEELVRMHREEGLSFKNVVSFNLDEYLPMPKESEQSYHYFMHHHLFDHIDIDPKNIHIPDGTLKAEEIENFCKEYERQIEAAGGIDIQVLGIGRTGHIGQRTRFAADFENPDGIFRRSDDQGCCRRFRRHGKCAVPRHYHGSGYDYESPESNTPGLG